MTKSSVAASMGVNTNDISGGEVRASGSVSLLPTSRRLFDPAVSVQPPHSSPRPFQTVSTSPGGWGLGGVGVDLGLGQRPGNRAPATAATGSMLYSTEMAGVKIRACEEAMPWIGKWLRPPEVGGRGVH